MCIFQKKPQLKTLTSYGLRNTLTLFKVCMLESAKCAEFCMSLNINTPILIEDVAIKWYGRRYLPLNVKYL